MSDTQDNPSGRTVLHIEGEMSIYRAAELKQVLLEALEQSTHLEINLSGVSEIDTAGMQLLMLAKKVAAERKQELHLTAHSHAVIEVIELLDLGAFFGDPLVFA